MLDSIQAETLNPETLKPSKPLNMPAPELSFRAERNSAKGVGLRACTRGVFIRAPSVFHIRVPVRVPSEFYRGSTRVP